MHPIKRRKFLQFVGASALTTLALSQFDTQQQGSSDRVLAQSTSRKLALLVGINRYADSRRFAPLKGCITDVELQQQLLIHRFGFNPKDVLTLTDEQATRQGILEAFEKHLIEQAQPEDVVVFHFSGYGSQMADPNGKFLDRLQSTLVPVNSSLQPHHSVPDITGQTLWLLLTALKTENVTAIIDATHPGDVIISDAPLSSPNISTGKSHRDTTSQLNAQERAYQQQWLNRLGLSPSEFIQQWQNGLAKGMVIASYQRRPLAAERCFGDVCAGTFTYLMTQYLWQQNGNEPAKSAIATIVRDVTRLYATTQTPQLAVKSNSGNENSPIYFLERQSPPAEAAITRIESKRVTLWLGGIEPESLIAFTQGAILTLIDRAGNEQGLVQLESRQGLVGVGKVLKAPPKAIQVGALLQERVRGIPDNLTLRIGLDSSLGDSLPQAQQTLRAIQFIEVLPVEQGKVDYILGRISAAYLEQLHAPSGEMLPPVGSIGLFLPGREFVVGSFGKQGENAIAAVKRLQPKFKSLLATCAVKLALNPNSSRLNVKAWMTREESDRGLLASTFTLRGSSNTSRPTQLSEPNKSSFATPSTTPVLPLQTPVQLHIANNESRILYCSILVLDAAREISVIFPNQWATIEDVMRVEAGQTLIVPDASKDLFRFVTIEPKGIAEVLIVASLKPLRKTLSSLRAIASRGGNQKGPIVLNAPDDPTEVITNLLDDLDASNSTAISATDNQGVRYLDTTQLAVLSIPFEVI